MKMKDLIRESEYSTKQVNRQKLQMFLQYLDNNNVDYSFDGNKDELMFDETELNKKGQELIKKIGLKELNENLISEQQIRKGDKVKSPYAGHKLTDGSTAPNYGEIINISSRVVYVDFGVSKSDLMPIMKSDLKHIGKTGSKNVWSESVVKEDSITITNWGSPNKDKKKLKIGDEVRWLQRGLNRYLTGKIIKFGEKQSNPNETSVEIKLDNGKTVKTKAWQLL